MPLSTHPQSLLDDRLESALRLTEKLGRAATLDELGAEWGTTRPQTNSVIDKIRWRGGELAVALMARRFPPTRDEERLLQLKKLTQSLGRTPTVTELADHWGVTKTRVRQILVRIDKMAGI